MKVAALGDAHLGRAYLSVTDPATGVNRRELLALQEAGVRGDALVASLTDPWPAHTGTDAVRSFLAGPAPTDPDDLATWLSRAIVVPTEELTRVD